MNKVLRKWLEWRRDRLERLLEECGDPEEMLHPYPQNCADKLLVFRAIQYIERLQDKLRKIERRLA